MFVLISLIIAITCISKGIVALVVPERFYRWRSVTQYQSERIPPIVLAMPLLMLLLAIASWYATFTQYQPWSWIVTSFTTTSTLLALVNLTRWSSHRHKVGSLIETQPKKRAALDGVLVVIGLGFLALAFFYYGSIVANGIGN